jgi:translation initiation factor 2B subunit (eIF-2B alpha/beta/delta family)
MTIHPEVRGIIAQFEARELHAARSGREVVQALADVIAESKASSLGALASELEANIDALFEAMPAYAPPLNAIHRVYARFEQALASREPLAGLQRSAQEAALAYQDWAAQSRSNIARYGASIIPENGVLFTFTLSETVLYTLRAARQMGQQFRVAVTESRPNNDGLVTAISLAREGIEVEVGIEGNIGEMIPRADVMLVGAEAILSDGSAICKVGTYPAALVAKRSRVPVYVLVDSMKLHATSLMGIGSWLDPLRGQDVIPDAASGEAAVCGKLFDVTPPDLITALITEKGLIHPEGVSQWMLEMPLSDTIAARLRNYRLT